MILLEDDEFDQVSGGEKEKKPGCHRKRLTGGNKLAKEQERQRKAEERKLRFERAAAAKQLKLKQRVSFYSRIVFTFD